MSIKLPIKKIILEQMMSEQDKFSIVTGALTPQNLVSHNTDIKSGIHDIQLNRHKYGFASKDEASHLHNNHLTSQKMAQYNNDLTLINSINNAGKSGQSNSSTPV